MRNFLRPEEAIPSEWRSQYRARVEEEMARKVRSMMGLVAVLMLLAAVLLAGSDRPQGMIEARNRLVLGVFFTLAFLLGGTRSARRHARLIGGFSAVLIAAAEVPLVLKLGHQAPNYVVIVGMLNVLGGYLPMSPLGTVVLGLLSSAVYLVPIGLLDPTVTVTTFAPAVYFTLQATVSAAWLSYSVSELRRREFFGQMELAREQQRSEGLLRNVLPEPIAARLKQQPGVIAEDCAQVTVLFADIVGFTELSAGISPSELVSRLNAIFTEFDRLAERHGLEKIKTIGDAYMVAGGVPSPRADHAEAVAALALDMQEAIGRFVMPSGRPFQLRMGIHAGPVVAGVIGEKRFLFDLWGDTVNVASRMESHGAPGRIHLSEETANLLGARFELEPRGEIDVKGRGRMRTCWLVGRKRAFESPAA